ncbi:hypothetical protein HPB48_006687 [Haemaphysalis longicornis]|uniref:Uncharacterized protein n=1 Tax=Haemaphysalis longicornis TaxID=44386 RepID=A0A9J6GBZ6_HAELO|nr:hypothetical protein HPB48_006687 [Haemaphysalis longicornis]
MTCSSLECSFPKGIVVIKGVNNGPNTCHESCTMRNVWVSNHWWRELQTVAGSFRTLSYDDMDTRFPGVLVRLDYGRKKSLAFLCGLDDPRLRPSAYQYAMVRDNVNLLNVNQVSLTFQNEDGNASPNLR